MATPPELKRLVDSQSFPEFLPPSVRTSRNLKEEFCPDELVHYIDESVLETLPNDLTRMIYMASLRDCNSGLYLHPDLSHQRGLHAVDRALQLCHEQVFGRLLSTPLPAYVSQLREYIRYTRGETGTVLKIWKSLKAYRATVPVAAPSVSTELFFLNIAIALEILSKQMPELQQD